MICSTSEITSPKANNYLHQLCKHFGHKVEITEDKKSHIIHLEFGSGKMRTGENTLVLIARADDVEKLERTETVLGRHLERFAFRENLHVIWSRSSTPQ